MEIGGGRVGTTGRTNLLADSTATLFGTTTITSGKVKLDGTGGTGTTNVVVSGGELGGTGTVAGAVTFANSAIAQIGPGDAGPGTLNLSNGMTLSASSVCNFEVGTAADVLACTGNVVLNGTLNVVPQAGLGVGAYTIMTTTGGAFSGNFTSIPPRGAYNFTTTVSPTSVVLNVTAPTPTSYTWTFAGGSSGEANVPAGVEAVTSANPLALRSGGLWSTATDWQSGIPVGSCATTINFNQNLAAYFSRMDINGSGQGSAFPLTPFVLNGLTLSNTTAAQTILWGAMHFTANGAANPVITQSAGSTQSFTFYTNLYADSNLTFAGAGSGTVFLGTGFSGGVNTIASTGTAVAGTGTAFGNNNNVFVGDTIVAVSGASSGQQRRVVSIGSTTGLTVDSAFTPDLPPANTQFVWSRSSEGLLRGSRQRDVQQLVHDRHFRPERLQRRFDADRRVRGGRHRQRAGLGDNHAARRKPAQQHAAGSRKLCAVQSREHQCEQQPASGRHGRHADADRADHDSGHERHAHADDRRQFDRCVRDQRHHRRRRRQQWV